MKIGAITTAYGLEGIPVHEAVKRIMGQGAEFVDINVDPRRLSGWELRELYKTVYGEGIAVYSVFALYDLVLVDPQVSREVVGSLKRRADFAASLGARNILAGVGRTSEVEDRRRAWETSVTSIREVAAHCGQAGLTIAVEMEPFESALVNDYESLQGFLRDVDSPACQANLDIAHCVLRGLTPRQVGTLGQAITHVHLADCDGLTHTEWTPGRGSVDFRSYLEALRSIGFDGGMSIELQPTPEPDALIREGIEYVRRILTGLAPKPTAAV